ncbi:efflux RND transporter periplasmic adaptor subunit [Pseudoalteromonas denitrificans]|uniref:Membrane fusion protein, multidrug efflux system n=1 Tax=Pseudoalteromonas denitrificans DSM 6059 TaxID=1123010 RepID=A0A1I1T432_9GAMM|nr:efflux RND transporter periplasmic adaptor subunit [Pseudoalteromonas denitrificans]SFD50080.1 membrane fusion protein, multidrug efflux system [Pseudoalteromonas denitrificans DSM 6059]
MKLYRWFITIFIIAITVSGLGFAKFQQIQAAISMAESFPEPSATVNSIITTTTQYQESEEVTGQVSATQVVKLQNELSGIITKVNFSAGQTVKKGQLLLAINSVEEQTQLDAAEANLRLAKNNFSRMTKLLSNKKVSQQEFDTANAQLHVDKASVENFKAIIAKKEILAPFDGVVGLETYQVGQFIAINSDITTLVGSESVVWIDFQLAQTKEKLKLGDSVLIKAINDVKTRYKTATIIAKNSQIKSQSRHMLYRAALDNGRQWYEHNEIVKIKVVKPSQSLVLVPNSAVSRNQSGNYLFVLEKDDNQQYRAHKIKVELGKRIEDQQIIKSGIEAGKRISTEGTFKLREGLLVYPKQINAGSITENVNKGE